MFRCDLFYLILAFSSSMTLCIFGFERIELVVFFSAFGFPINSLENIFRIENKWFFLFVKKKSVEVKLTKTMQLVSTQMAVAVVVAEVVAVAVLVQ